MHYFRHDKFSSPFNNFLFSIFLRLFSVLSRPYFVFPSFTSAFSSLRWFRQLRTHGLGNTVTGRYPRPLIGQSIIFKCFSDASRYFWSHNLYIHNPDVTISYLTICTFIIRYIAVSRDFDIKILKGLLKLFKQWNPSVNQRVGVLASEGVHVSWGDTRMTMPDTARSYQSIHWSPHVLYRPQLAADTNHFWITFQKGHIKVSYRKNILKPYDS